MDQIQRIGPATSVDAGDVLRILWRRSWAIVLVLGASLGVSYFVSTHTPSRWKASAQMMLIQRSGMVVMTAQALASAPTVENPETQVAMLTGPAMAYRTVDWMKNDAREKGKQQTRDFDIDLDEFRKSVAVAIPKDTNLIQVDVDAESRSKALEWADAVCNAFVDWKKEIARTNTRDTLGNLEERTKSARAQMIEAERQETLYKQNHRMADVNTEQQALVSEFIRRGAEVSNAQAEVASDLAKVNTLSARLKEVNETIKAGDGVRDDALVLSLQSQLEAKNIELENAKLRFTEAFPGILPDLKAQINDLKDRLSKAVRSTLDNKKPSLQSQGQLAEDYKQAQTVLTIGEAKLKSAVALRDQLKSQTANIPRTGMEFARLSRNADSARQLHTQLQTALNAARLDKDMAEGNVRITQLAYAPELPYLPNRIRDMVFGLVIGLFLSMVSVLLLEQGDKRVRTLETVRRLAPGPVVGALPRLSHRQLNGFLAGNEDPNAIEAYSLARANLSLAHRQNGQKSLWGRQIVLVTSAVPGEGKSLTAFQMARSIARSGRSVILVDADMRRPTQNRLFNTDEPYGLADVLSDDMTLEDALVSSDIDSLHVLHSGQPQRNPTDLVSTPKMLETLEKLRNEADVVVIDTPACSVVADALLLAPHADCILHVIGAGQVDEDLVNDTAAALRAASPKTLAFFVNRAPKERRGSYNSYYYYTGWSANSSTKVQPLPAIEEIDDSEETIV